MAPVPESKDIRIGTYESGIARSTWAPTRHTTTRFPIVTLPSSIALLASEVPCPKRPTSTSCSPSVLQSSIAIHSLFHNG